MDPVLVKALLEPFGALRPQAATEWKGADPLPEAVATFYREVGPWGETHHENVGPVGCTLTVGGNPVRIPPLHKLERLQAGYAWSKDPLDRLQGWDDDWLVIAEQGGDPFILEKSTGAILFAFHGAGSWTPRVFARDLMTAIGSLATVAAAYLALDDTDFIDDEPTASAVAKIRDRLMAFVGDRERVETMLSAWDYLT